MKRILLFLFAERMMSPTENPAAAVPEDTAVQEREEEDAPMEVDDNKAEEAAQKPLENGDDQQEEQMEAEDEKTDANKEDVEKFGGKIVYNPDGSAYIIEDGNEEGDDLLPIPKVEGSIVDDGEEVKDGEQYPQIANAFYISKSTAYYNALYGGAYVKMLQEKKVPETPVVHSYRVFSARDGGSKAAEDEEAAKKHPLSELATVPVKPILMCFVCKLSFGCAQTFETHCVESHKVELDEKEKGLLGSKNSSAIIQNVGKEKEPIVSFLEPVTSSSSSSNGGSGGDAAPSPAVSTPSAPSSVAAAALAAAAANPASFPPGAISQFLSAAAAAAGLPKVPTLAEPSSPPLASEQQQRKSPLSVTASPSATPSLSNAARRSPLEEQSRSGGASPSASPASPLSLPPPPPSTYNLNAQVPTNANMLQGTTIGACPDHVNGRPTGVDCAKCDLILNQSRLSGMGWNVSRNSCKTLKCPKCNWHYKYQETLEIHMKEKHPENETTCIYCITGQQHPRLARGETYTCGYKPYRCEVCNYSTTTKGNLSIHMQSDKHLNNMQDLQNGGLLPPSTPPGGEAPKLPLPPSTSNNSRSLPPSQSPLPSPSKQQKPNWRCDVCNYETNVARNLRIHMTSEKHTHNIMSIQQQSAKTMQQLMAGGAGAPPPGLPAGFPRLPAPPGLDPKNLLGMFAGGLAPPTSSASSEQAAMADLAYNQALLAQIMSGGQFPGWLPPPPLRP